MSNVRRFGRAAHSGRPEPGANARDFGANLEASDLVVHCSGWIIVGVSHSEQGREPLAADHGQPKFSRIALGDFRNYIHAKVGVGERRVALGRL